MFLNEFVSEKCRCLEYREPEKKHGVLNGDKFKTRKYNEKKNEVLQSSQVHHLRSDAYSAGQVLLNKRRIWAGTPKLDCYQKW